MAKWEGFKDTIDKIYKGTPVTQEEKDKYYRFIQELSSMLDQVPDIVGTAVRSHFWMEISRERMIRNGRD